MGSFLSVSWPRSRRAIRRWWPGGRVRAGGPAGGSRCRVSYGGDGKQCLHGRVPLAKPANWASTGAVDVLEDVVDRGDAYRRSGSAMLRAEVADVRAVARPAAWPGRSGRAAASSPVKSREDKMHLASAGRADLHGQPRVPPPVGRKPPLASGKPNRLSRRGEPHAGGEQELQPAAAADPVDGADRHLRQGLPHRRQGLQDVDVVVLLCGTRRDRSSPGKSLRSKWAMKNSGLRSPRTTTEVSWSKTSARPGRTAPDHLDGHQVRAAGCSKSTWRIGLPPDGECLVGHRCSIDRSRGVVRYSRS